MKIDLKGLAYAGCNLTSSVRPIRAEDIKDLKIRVMENEVYIAAFKAMGVNAVPGMFELHSLAARSYSGQENPVNVIHHTKCDSQICYMIGTCICSWYNIQ